MSDPFNIPPTGPVYGGQPAASNYAAGPPFQPTAEVLATAPKPRRSRGKMIGIVVGVGAVIAAGAFALTQLNSNESSGGAASPDELADEFTAALNNEDALGVIDLLLPGERDTFRQPLIDLVSELNRLEVTDKTASLDQVAGIDIEITTDEVTIDETNVDDIVHVNISGESTVTVNGEELPIGDLLVDQVFDGERPEIDNPDDSTGDFNVSFTAVQRDGRWYLSAFYTIAESQRGDADIPDDGIAPDGADSPEEALDNVLVAATQLDLERVIAGLNPNEAEALQRYAPLFIDDMQAPMDEAGVGITLSDTEYSVSGDGNRRQVALTAATVEVAMGDGTLEVALADGCVTVKGEDVDLNSCEMTGDDQGDEMGSQIDALGLPDSDAIKDLVEDASAAFEGFSLHGIVVDNVDGKWYVSPIGTSFETILAVTRVLDRDEIETLINDVSAVADSFFTTFESSSDDTYDDSYDDGSDDDSTSDISGDWYSCLSQPTDAAAQCIADGVAAGDFAADEIPAPYLYPECGLFEYYNGATLYSDTADEFWANVSPGVDCIVAAAERDGLVLDNYTIEFVKPECFQEVSPYNFDDSDKYEEAIACAYQ